MSERVISEPLRVLIVEDDPLDADLALIELQRAAIAVDFRVADNEVHLRGALADFAPDVVLCDLSLRGMSGTRAIHVTREVFPDVPVIIVTGSLTEPQAVIAMQAGAVDYVLKSSLARLAVAVLRAVDDASEKRQHAERQGRIERLSRIRSVLSAVNEAVLRIGDRNELLREACRIAFEAGGFANVLVVAADAKANRFGLEAFCGDTQFFAEPFERMLAGAMEAAEREEAPTALRTMRPVIVQDIATRADMRELPLYRYCIEHGIRSSGSFPLMVEDRPVGVMVFTSDEADYFDEEEVALLDSLVANLAFALNDIKRQERILRLSRMRDVILGVNEAIIRLRDSRELFREARRIAHEGGIFNNVFAFTIVPETRRVKLETPIDWLDSAEFERSLQRAVDDFESGRSAVQISLRKLSAAVVNDVETLRSVPSARRMIESGIGAVGSFPLVVDGRAIGAMVYSSLEPEYFDAEEVSLLTALSNNLAFALVRLEEQRRIARLSRIRDILSSVNETIVRVRDSSELFREACRIAFEAGGFINVFLFTVSSDLKRADLQAVLGTFDADALRQRLQTILNDGDGGFSTIRGALQTKRPAFINNIGTGGGVRNTGELQSVKAVGCFPIVVDDRVVAAMAFNTDEANYFDEEEVALLWSLANDLAFALAHLAEQQKVARLSRIRNMLSRVNEAIVRHSDRDALFEAACRIAYGAGGFVSVFVLALDPKTKGATIPAAAGAWADAREEHERALQQSVKHSSTGSSALDIVLRTRRAAVENDVRARTDIPAYKRLVEQGVAAVGLFPLLVGADLVGVMFFDTNEAGYFDGEEIELLTSLTNNLSFALAAMSRQERIARLSRIRDVLSAVNAAIVRLRDRNELYQEVCRIAVQAGGFMNVYVVEVDIESRDCDIPAFLGTSDREEARRSLRERLTRSGVAPGLVETAMSSLHSSVRNDLTKDGRRGRLGVQSTGAFPLVVNGRALGALVVETEVAGYFDAEEVDLLTSLAGNLSFALELLDKQNRVDYLSYYDALTQLPNRTLFYDRLAQDLAAARKAGKILALVLLDISRFSMLNNTLGEHVGDDVLRRVADRLRETAEESRIARVAGDRFVLCFPMLDDLRPVFEIVTEDSVKIFDAPLRVQDRELHIMTRAGVAIFPSDGNDAEALFQNAEAALLDAKASGTTYRFYAPELNAQLAKRLDLEARLQRAIEEHQFVLYYQPKIELRDRRCVGFEALIRWKDPERGLIPPGDFVPLLEQTGLIIGVGRWALSEAVRQYEEWKAAGLKPPHIAVNLSAVQLRQERIVDDVRDAIAQFTGECGLDLEVTESMLMENFDAAIAKLKAVRELGVQLSLDDFGTGYSSLSYIHRLPLNALKIDRSFIVGMDKDADKTSIVSTILSLAQALRLKVIAEGVETEEQARLLLLLRCDQIQGYLIGKPEPPETAVRFMNGA